MGVAINRNDCSFKTEAISAWISKVKSKKRLLRRRKRKNFLIEAVLTNALCKAEIELKHKQQQRLQRWRTFQSKLRKNLENNTTPAVWDTGTCEELNSFDQFMSQLKEIKFPLDR